MRDLNSIMFKVNQPYNWIYKCLQTLTLQY